VRGGITHPSGFEEEAYARGFRCVGGIDEAGRGPWAGPVVAAAVVLPRGLSDPEIKDSKLLTAAKREEAAARIKERAIAWGLGIVEVEEIDRINILKASLLAMAHAYQQLRPMPDCLLIDGPHSIPVKFLRRVQEVQDIQNDLNGLKRFKPLPVQRAIVKGDRLSISIAAASILAKVARDRIMEDYDRLYPEYGFAKHKGYSSAEHLAALRRLGPAPIHRKSFRPVRESLNGILVTRWLDNGER
jgi:ribonuclease HII